MQMFNQPMQNNPGTSPLIDAISRSIMGTVQRAVQAGAIGQFVAPNLTAALKQYIPTIVQALNAQYSTGVPSQVVDNTVMQYAKAIIPQLQPPVQQPMYPQQGYNPQQQQPGFGYQQPNYNAPPQNFGLQPSPMFTMQPQQFNAPQSGFGNVGATQTNLQQGLPTMSHNIPTQPKAVTAEAPKALTTSGKLPEIFKSADPSHKYTEVVDQMATQNFSTKVATVKDGYMVEVRRKSVITDENNDVVNSVTACCCISEISMERSIINFKKTNPKLVNGKYLNLLTCNTFVLKEIKCRNYGKIDLSELSNLEHREIPAEAIISKIIDAIGERDFPIVEAMSELIVNRFNAYVYRYLRIDDEFGDSFRATCFKDIVELAGLRSREVLMSLHPEYEDTVLFCFKKALDTIIIADTEQGFFPVEKIAGDLPTHPDFVLRQNGIFERDPDITNPDFVNAVRNKFCAFASIWKVAVGNFIPNELYDDLKPLVNIKIQEYTSVLDWLLINPWKKELPDKVILEEGDRRLVIGIGRTMDGTLFMFQDFE